MAARIAPREFAVATPPYDPRLMIAVLIALPELLIMAVLLAMQRPGHAALALQANTHITGILVVPVATVFAGMILLLLWAVRRRRIVLSDGVLDATATFYRRRLPVAALDLDKARIVNLDEHREWRPLFKTNGVGLPGLRAGWFRSRGFVKMFCLLTTRDRVLVLPELAGGVLLLSAERPQELLQALRETAGASRAGD